MNICSELDEMEREKKQWMLSHVNPKIKRKDLIYQHNYIVCIYRGTLNRRHEDENLPQMDEQRNTVCSLFVEKQAQKIFTQIVFKWPNRKQTSNTFTTQTLNTRIKS